jgi:poly(3-hydroxybutyrate) depolymerase
VQVWQGSADRTVVPANAEAIVLQWAHLHGLEPEPDREEEVEGYPRRVWLGRGGERLIEQYTITGMAHGVPLAGGGEDPLGRAGAHMLDVGLSSTARIAAFFGLAPEEAARAAASTNRDPSPRRARAPGPATGPQAVIEKALRAAGLMR